MDREGQRALPLQDVLEAGRAALRARTCLHPQAPSGCGRVVGAHTVQMRRGLNFIARAGKVYAFLPTDAIAMEKAGGRLREQLVGIGGASTFNGFCNQHDDALFAPIEKREPALSRETAFLFGYRALCRELYLKRAFFDFTKLLRELDRGKPPEFQAALQAFADMVERPARAGLRDMEAYKAEADRMLGLRDLGNVRYYALEFERTPDIALATGWFPTHDFRDRELQLLDSKGRLDLILVCVQPWERGGLALLTWWGDRPACSAFVRSLHELPDAVTGDAMVRLTTENVYMRPQWWEGLNEGRREAIRERLNTAVDLTRGWPSLIADGVRYCDWGAVSRSTNLAGLA